MNYIELLEKYGIVLYFLIILFGGKWGERVITPIKSKFVRFNIFSAFFALLFNVLEYLQGTFDVENLTKYLFTYLLATFVYDKWGNKIPFLKGNE